MLVHCKNIRAPTDISWRVFHILTEPVTYTFVSVYRHWNVGPGFSIPSIYTNVYGTGFVKIWKTRHKVSVDVRIFFTVCSLQLLWFSDNEDGSIVHQRRSCSEYHLLSESDDLQLL